MDEIRHNTHVAHTRVSRDAPWNGDAHQLREHHANRFVFVVRPIVVTLMLGIIAITLAFDPRTVHLADLLVLGAAVCVALGAIPLRHRVSALRLAYWTAMIDLVLLLGYTFATDEPAQTSILLCWPLVILAYFSTPRITLIAAGCTSTVLLVASLTLDTWTENAFVPVATYGVFITALLITLMSMQGRRVEHALAAALARDHVAFLLARRIRMADDPRDAITQIAEALGSATDASQAIVMLLEHDDDYLAEISSWHGEHHDDDATPLDVTVIDATLRHLVATGHGAVLEHGSVRVLAPEGSAEATMLVDSAVDASMRALLHRLDAGSGLVTALPMAGRTVGAIVLTGTADHEWSRTAIPLLEPLAPQLAAGLAQVVLVRDQRDALESIERVDRMRDRLIANVSHELRTPLTSTMGFVETALRDDIDLDDATRRELLAHARDGGMRLLSLVEDLLALGSTRPEVLDLAPQPLDVTLLIADALRGIEAPDGRSIIVRVDPDIQITADRNRMIQVVSNLVLNAIRHGQGSVQVEAVLRRRQLILDVLDEGPGVPPSHVQELFLPFSRFSTRSDSTGLGLAICRTIVGAHGGTIDYDRVDRRTRFRVRIPTNPPQEVV